MLLLGLTDTLHAIDPTFFPDRSAKIFFRPSPSDEPAQQSHLVDLTYESTDVAEAAKADEPPPKPSTGQKVKQTIKQTVEGSSARDIEIGTMGIVHPEVLGHFEIDMFACSALEFDLEPFL